MIYTFSAEDYLKDWLEVEVTDEERERLEEFGNDVVAKVIEHIKEELDKLFW